MYDLPAGRARVPGLLAGRAPWTSVAARLRQRQARSLDAGSVGTAVARDLMCEIGLGREHALGRAVARLRADVAAARRARPRERVELGGRDDTEFDFGGHQLAHPLALDRHGVP